MTWSLLWTLLLALAGTLLCLVHRRRQQTSTRAARDERAEAMAHGSHEARLQYPFVDLSRCVGCGTCIAACPEEGVLGLVYGQAAVIHGAHCVGHGRCAEACPVGAIEVTLGDLSNRRDIPVLDDQLQAEGMPGLYLAGEVTGYALVRTAIMQGVAVAEHVASTLPEAAGSPRRNGHTTRSRGGVALADRDDALDLCIVGAGPAGLACSLAAKQHGLATVTLERERMGGTVAQYPRRKLVMTQPVELPLHGRLKRTSYEKEELVEMWERIAAEQQLPIRTGEEFVGLSRDDDGVFTVKTKTGSYRAHNVCLCLGRRGTPRKLGVPGEDLPKVAYSLMDADSYRGRRVLVVGGGDSAVEAAIALAEQPGNEVTLSYRKGAFSRIKARNRRNLEKKVADGRGPLRLLLESEVSEIRPDAVVLSVAGPMGPEAAELPNDEVFVFAGGVPPFKLLEQAHVSFDPAMRAAAVGTTEQGTGIVRALFVALVLTAAALGFALWFSDYYGLDADDKAASPWHDLLKPTGVIGLLFGVGACVLILTNLAYLIRRSRLGAWIAGSLQYWLSIHVVTGLLAMLLLLLHGGMEVRDTSGGIAFVAVVVLVISGAVGRYFYSYLPRAANGNELALDEVKGSLSAVLAEWDREGRVLGAQVQSELAALQSGAVWQASLPRRIAGLFVARRQLQKALVRIEREARRQGLARGQVQQIVSLARRVHRAALMARHYEDLFGLLSSWRFVHRWIALAMVLLAISHVASAMRYARFG